VAGTPCTENWIWNTWVWSIYHSIA